MGGIKSRVPDVMFFCVAMLMALSAGGSNSSSSPATKLPAAAQANLSAALGRDIPDFKMQAGNGFIRARNARNHLIANFSRAGVQIHAGAKNWQLKFCNYGYAQKRDCVEDTAPVSSSNRVDYRRGAITEWYVNGPLGLEQGFTISRRPSDAQRSPLVLSLSLSGDLTPIVDSDRTGVLLPAGTGAEDLRYMGLTARDADGKPLHAEVQLQGSWLLLKVDDHGARYPLTVDPLLQLAKLTASDGEANGQFGYSVSIDGSTLVVGAWDETINGNERQGAAYVFVKPPSGWANMTQTAKLTASDGGARDQLGLSVAISGNTVIAGASCAHYSAGCGPGIAYVFQRPAGGWHDTTEVAKLTSSDGAAKDAFGASVAIAGNTAVIGAWNKNSARGSAYVFVRPPSGWTSMTENAKLSASDGVSNAFFGISVAVYSDTAVVGAYGQPVGTNQAQGAVYVFVRPASGWVNATRRLNFAPPMARPEMIWVRWFRFMVTPFWRGLSVRRLVLMPPKALPTFSSRAHPGGPT